MALASAAQGLPVHQVDAEAEAEARAEAEQVNGNSKRLLLILHHKTMLQGFRGCRANNMKRMPYAVNYRLLYWRRISQLVGGVEVGAGASGAAKASHS